MKQELITLAQNLAEQLAASACHKSLQDAHQDALNACIELCRAIGHGHSMEELPAITKLYSGIIDTLPNAHLGCTFWKEEDDDSTEVDTWQEATRCELYLYGISLKHSKLEDMAEHVAKCIWLAVSPETSFSSHHERDGEQEFSNVYKEEQPQSALSEVMFHAIRDGKIKRLKVKIERYTAYVEADKELLEKHPDKHEYKRRLINHQNKLERMKASLAKWESAE